MMAYSSNNNETIRELNENDVLCGRGPGLSQFEGNLRFHKLVNARKKQYNADSTNRREKKRLAQEILSHIHVRGGRFLKQVNVQDSLDTEWYEVEASVSEEKVKQALREKTTRNSSECGLKRSISGSLLSSDMATNDDSCSSINPLESLPTVSAQISPPFASDRRTIIDPRLMLFQRDPLGDLQEQMAINTLLASSPPPEAGGTLSSALQHKVTNLISVNIAAAVAHQRSLADAALYSMLQNVSCLQIHSRVANSQLARHTIEEALSDSVVVTQTKSGINTLTLGAKTDHADYEQNDKVETTCKEGAPSPIEADEQEEVAAFLLSSLALTNRPIITSEQEAMELATLTSEEQAEILSDTFGDFCNVSSHHKKRARLAHDPNSVAFHLRQMLLEVEAIPKTNKLALLEALSKGQKEHFSYERLEKFLRCEGMNAKLAAQRLVNYWEGRKKVFGDDKYLLPMTLAEALKDDLVALDCCVYTLLPYPDRSGRQILFMDPHRHSRKGYTSESMLRAIWYVSEVTAQHNKDNSSAIVQCCWFQNASLFDYDLKVFDRWAHFLSNCWPIKLAANHLCCPSAVVNRVVIPIVHTFVSKEWRARTLTHNVPVENILEVLAKFGIEENMLPVEMGGSVQNHQVEFLRNQRAVELQEI